MVTEVQLSNSLQTLQHTRPLLCNIDKIDSEFDFVQQEIEMQFDEFLFYI